MALYMVIGILPTMADAIAAVCRLMYGVEIRDDFSALAESLREYHMESCTVLEGKAVDTEKYVEFYPNEEALQRLVIGEFYERIEKP